MDSKQNLITFNEDIPNPNLATNIIQYPKFTDFDLYNDEKTPKALNPKSNTLAQNKFTLPKNSTKDHAAGAEDSTLHLAKSMDKKIEQEISSLESPSPLLLGNNISERNANPIAATDINTADHEVYKKEIDIINTAQIRDPIDRDKLKKTSLFPICFRKGKSRTTMIQDKAKYNKSGSISISESPNKFKKLTAEPLSSFSPKEALNSHNLTKHANTDRMLVRSKTAKKFFLTENEKAEYFAQTEAKRNELIRTTIKHILIGLFLISPIVSIIAAFLSYDYGYVYVKIFVNFVILGISFGLYQLYIIYILYLKPMNNLDDEYLLMAITDEHNSQYNISYTIFNKMKLTILSISISCQIFTAIIIAYNHNNIKQSKASVSISILITMIIINLSWLLIYKLIKINLAYQSKHSLEVEFKYLTQLHFNFIKELKNCKMTLEKTRKIKHLNTANKVDMGQIIVNDNKNLEKIMKIEENLKQIQLKNRKQNLALIQKQQEEGADRIHPILIMITLLAGGFCLLIHAPTIFQWLEDVAKELVFIAYPLYIIAVLLIRYVIKSLSVYPRTDLFLLKILDIIIILMGCIIYRFILLELKQWQSVLFIIVCKYTYKFIFYITYLSLKSKIDISNMTRINNNSPKKKKKTAQNKDNIILDIFQDKEQNYKNYREQIYKYMENFYTIQICDISYTFGILIMVLIYKYSNIIFIVNDTNCDCIWVSSIIELTLDGLLLGLGGMIIQKINQYFRITNKNPNKCYQYIISINTRCILFVYYYKHLFVIGQIFFYVIMYIIIIPSYT